ncbi:AraC family transcriptional regulator [Pseudodesulfovibrio tunisiensis]|uniref:AraC family transcriptional regulator n=1 Tax=Pseudodesulfovibrio tunisiensis TaxID=463192 RepID=UPI001FB1F976|nr:AraC family transcriptional regulator [Pseudodesulfovibrio tunisiensis]
MIDMGLNPAEVLTLAGLPADLFSRGEILLGTEDYFALWSGLEKTAGKSALPLLIAEKLSTELFNPPMFAALCSPNFNVAMQRLSQFKRLVGPLNLTVAITPERTMLSVDCVGYNPVLPQSIGITELVIMTWLIRKATRHAIIPHSVIFGHEPDNIAAYEEFFQISVDVDEFYSISFAAEDATRPFLTENVEMWNFFEPRLKQRLSDLDSEAPTSQRVKSALLEMLPRGQSSIEDAAEVLATSKRTLQRKLGSEGVSYQKLLSLTRKELAFHYLANSSLPASEISFLLGFQDTNSFARAFSSWTGITPKTYRQSVVQ